MFYEDAEVASRELGLTLTARNNGAAANVPLAGFPVKAGSDYTVRQVTLGARLEDELTRGHVQRGETRQVAGAHCYQEIIATGVEKIV